MADFVEIPVTSNLHKGFYDFHGEGGQSLSLAWAISGGVVHLFDHKKPITLTELLESGDLSESDELNLMGDIVAAYREAHRDDSSNFHGAALHLMQRKSPAGAVEEERLVISNNIDPVYSYNRACAEMRALHQGISELKSKREDIKLARTYFMGQKKPADKEPTKYERSTPCSHCREEMISLSDKDSQLFIYPAMSRKELSDVYFQVDDLSEQMDFGGKYLEPKQDIITKVSTQQLLPIPKVSVRGEIWREHMLKGMGLVESKAGDRLLEKMMHAPEEIGKGGIKALSAEGGYTLENVNKALVDEVRKRYKRDTLVSVEEGEPQKIRAVLVRKSDGQCYISSEVIDGNDPAHPSATTHALMKSGRSRDVVEVFVMDYDASLHGALEQKPDNIELDAFNGHELDRIYKKTSLPKGDPYTDVLGREIKGRVIMHVMPINDGNLNHEELQQGLNTIRLSQAYPLAFQYPKDTTGPPGLA